MASLAPIVVFLYNRPLHAKRTLDALAANPEASESRLFIFCDGPKITAKESDLKKINEVKALAHAEKRFANCTVIEQEKNIGLSASIVSGVGKIIEKYGRVIVLEDDLLTSKLFLSYMNRALETYDEKKNVACISGYVYPLKKKVQSAFFLKGADCWGWATWKDRWEMYESDPLKLKSELISSKRINEFNFNNSYPYFSMLEDRIAGKNQSWAVMWYASAFLKNKLCLYPASTLVQNIGNDGSGTHSGKDEKYGKIKEEREELFPTIIEESAEGRKQFELFFNSGKPSLLSRVKAKARSVGRKLLGVKPYGWSGDYASWQLAQKECTGYDNQLILDKVYNAVLKVKSGEAKYERDSVLFNEIYMFEPLLNALKKTVNNNELSVVDFGGSLGSSYFQFRDQFKDLIKFKWIVIEQKHFVELGNKDIADASLSFANNVKEALAGKVGQVLYISNVLQYLPDPISVVNELAGLGFEHIILDKLAVIIRDKDRLCIQNVPPEIYKASYPSWFFNEKEITQIFLANYEMMDEFIDEIPDPMFLGTEKVLWKGFHFRLKQKKSD